MNCSLREQPSWLLEKAPNHLKCVQSKHVPQRDLVKLFDERWQ